MTLVRYRPYRGIMSLQDEVNRLFDTMMRPAGGNEVETWVPACDLRETESEYIVRAELPGISREDVKINLINNTLYIRGEKKQETEDRKGSWHHVERSYGAFERTFSLPTAVSNDKIRAKFMNGVLEIVVPKADEAKPREIQIEG
jgi:HSP20 family protein